MLLIFDLASALFASIDKTSLYFDFAAFKSPASFSSFPSESIELIFASRSAAVFAASAAANSAALASASALALFSAANFLLFASEILELTSSFAGSIINAEL